MNTLRDKFFEAASTPAPPSKLNGAEVYATAWRRRRVRTGLAVVGGFTAVAVVVAGVVALTGSPSERRAPAGPEPAVSSAAPIPTSTASSQSFYRDGVVLGARAADGDHMYATRMDCPTSKLSSACTTVLLGTDDGGRTWTIRARGIGQLDVPTSGVLVTTKAGKPGTTQSGAQFSTDGGRTWKVLYDVTPGAARSSAVPAGGWLICRGTSGADLCMLYAVDPKTGRPTRLATQPSIDFSRVETVPAGANLWVTGHAPGGGHAAVAVSHDRGLTWAVHVFGPGEPGFPTQSNDETAAVTSLDGTIGYAVVSVSGSTPADRHAYVYRTGDGGTTWQRVDPHATLPYAYEGYRNYLAADGTHVVEPNVEDVATWYASTDGGTSYRKPAGVAGLSARLNPRDPVLVEAPGVYITFDQAAVYRSTDGLHFTRVPVPHEPR